jgi:hypothetical protein
VVRAEIEHFLGFCDPADHRTSDTLRRGTRLWAGTAIGSAGNPTMINVPSVFSVSRYLFTSCGAETVFRMKSKYLKVIP